MIHLTFLYYRLFGYLDSYTQGLRAPSKSRCLCPYNRLRDKPIVHRSYKDEERRRTARKVQKERIVRQIMTIETFSKLYYK